MPRPSTRPVSQGPPHRTGPELELDLDLDLELERDRDRDRDPDLASAAAHQLRGPLTVMRGVLETAARQTDLEPEARAELLERGLAAAGRQADLIAGLLDASARFGARGPSGAFTPKRLDVQTAVARVLRECLTPEERGRVVIEGPRNLHVMVDPVALDCIVANLVSNAVSHTPGDSPVEITAGRRNGEVEVVVADQGSGIAPEDQERIFRPYERSSPVAGAGLGLAIARWAAEASGGAIWVQSEPGQGARFCFTLPAAPHRDSDQSSVRVPQGSKR